MRNEKSSKHLIRFCKKMNETMQFHLNALMQVLANEIKIEEKSDFSNKQTRKCKTFYLNLLKRA